MQKKRIKYNVVRDLLSALFEIKKKNCFYIVTMKAPEQGRLFIINKSFEGGG